MKPYFKIIPAIDIIDGKCVRLTQGDYNTKKIYNENPLEVAKQFEGVGIQYLHVVDLDGAKSRHIVNQKILEQIATHTNLIIDFGGGIKTSEDIQIAFDSGASQITCGSIAVSNHELVSQWMTTYGANKIILGADCKSKKITTHGWMKESTIDVIPFIQRYKKIGLSNAICTDVAKDGLLQGPSIDLYSEIISQTKINLIASGGISSVADIQATEDIGCAGVIIGKAIYEGYISLIELSKLC